MKRKVEEAHWKKQKTKKLNAVQEVDNSALENIVPAEISVEWERLPTTISGRTVTRRSETDFFSI